MNKNSFLYSFIAFSLVVVFGAPTAQASTQYAYYPAATNYYDSYRNCTPGGSDLGLGGGVFVSGTTICPQTVYPSYGYTPTYTNTPSYSYEYDDSSDSDEQYNDEEYEDDSSYEENEDDSDSSEDEDQSDNDDSSDDEDTDNDPGSIW